MQEVEIVLEGSYGEGPALVLPAGDELPLWPFVNLCKGEFRSLEIAQLMSNNESVLTRNQAEAVWEFIQENKDKFLLNRQ